MPGATTASGASPGTVSGSANAVPFVVGSNHYSEQFFQVNVTPGANAQEYVYNITPGGFLRGVRLSVLASGGSGSTTAAVAAADAPWSVFSSISLENIDGSPIKYPMGGLAYYLQNKYCRPWNGDPAKRATFSPVNSGGNFYFDLDIYPEIRDTAGVLANTDARAQYRIRFTVAPVTQLFTTSPAPTLPTLTITGFMTAWAQTDPKDLHGNPIQPTPDGLSLAGITRHQILTLNGAGADNTFQLTNTGNEIRCVIAVIRDSTGARQDYLSTPIRIRLDNRQLDVPSFQKVLDDMCQFYDFLANGTSVRETGVLVFPRFRKPGDLVGQFWLGTSNATYLIFESTTPSNAVNVPGTVEFITDEVVPVAPVPVELEGV